MARKNYSYKDKNVIISVFNESQVHYRKYEELIGGNPSEAQKELNTAANKLQQSFELGLKCYLNLRYKELVNEHVINWSQYRDFVKIIENGRHSNNRMVDIRYLYDQMNCYAKRELEKPTEERRRKMQADRRSAPSPCLDWNCQKEMKAVRLQGSISLNRENYRNNW